MQGAGSAQGIVHIHTELSFDGTLSPARIAELCRSRGLSFAAIADHAESMTAKLLDRLVAQCRENSDSDLVLIPGLEYRYKGGVHILALGQDEWVSAGATLETLRTLKERGCVLVAAHCASSHDLTADLLDILTAMEIWNVGRDTRLLPTTRQLSVYKKLAVSYPNLYAIGGLDMHKGCEWGCEVALDPLGEVSSEAVLERIRKGRFCTRSRFLSFESRLPGGTRELAFAAGDVLAIARDLRNRVFR